MDASLAFFSVLKRDLQIAGRRRAELANPMVFYAIVVSLFPLALGAEPALLARIAPGVIWVGALLSALLSMEGGFRSDYDDGSLEQLLLSPHPLPMLVAAKTWAHWLISGLPMLLATPVLAILMGLPFASTLLLLVSLLLGTPVLSLMGTVGAAFTVGLRRGGVVLSLILLPLYVPVLIFGAGVVSYGVDGLPVTPLLYLMAAILVLSAALAPFAAAAALRVSVG